MTTALTTELLPEVAELLTENPVPGVIGGEDVLAGNGAIFTTRDPGSGQPLAEVTAMQADDVDRAVRAAQRAFDTTGWPRMSPNERGVLLHRLADAVERHKDALVQIEALDTGKIPGQAEWEVQDFADTLRYYTDLALHVQRRSPLAISGNEVWISRQPWGPCAFIFPWNFPVLLMGWNLSPALAAGNTVIVKPPEDAPLGAIYLARLAREVGIPDGVINVVPGFGDPAGAALAAHPGIRRMLFTGSPEVGRQIAAACGRNLVPVKLELGGKGAAVVFDDVDVAQTVEQLAQAICFHAGQVCCDPTRWLVHRSIYKEFVKASVTRLRSVKIGYQLDADTQLGPVVSEKQRERRPGLPAARTRGGGRGAFGGRAAGSAGLGRLLCQTSVLAGSLDNVAAREEIFGPVAFLAPFADEAEAIRLANQTRYGLANSVWTADLARANRVAEAMVAGTNWINSHNVFAQGIPYAGVGQSGFGGGVLSVETLFDYWRNTSIVRPV